MDSEFKVLGYLPGSGRYEMEDTRTLTAHYPDASAARRSFEYHYPGYVVTGMWQDDERIAIPEID